MPKVSFIITIHNGETHLKTCIDSVLSQTFKDFECITLNNGSTDRTQEILEQYTDSRLKIIQQENIGVSRSLNKGVHLSKSNLIARLDADDVASKHRLERQVEFMIKNPKVVLCGSKFRELIGVKSLPQKVAFIETDPSIRKSMSLFNPFSHSTVIFRKENFIQAGGYSVQYRNSLDYELWLRILDLGEAHILNDELCDVRFTKQSVSYQNKRRQKLEGLFYIGMLLKNLGGESCGDLLLLDKKSYWINIPLYKLLQ